MPVIFEAVYSDELLSHHIHAHVCCEILYLLEGEAAIAIRGREYRARGGDLVFLNQLEEHATRLLTASYRRYYLLIPPGEMQGLHRDARLLSVFRLHGGAFPYVLSTGERRARFDFYFSLLWETAQTRGEDRDSRMEALLTLILTDVRALRPDLFSVAREKELLPIQEILDILDEELDVPFSLENLAKRYHVSPGCLSAHFRHYVGMSPMQYVTQSRLAQAKRLLIQTGLPVQAIARQCGYGDLSNFSRRFKQQFQATPQQFRRACQAGPRFLLTPDRGSGREIEK